MSSSARNRRSNNQNSLFKKLVKNAIFVLLILIVCGILAFVLSGLLFHYIIEDHLAPSSKNLVPVKWKFKPFVKNSTHLQTLPPAASCGKRIVGYYTEWETPKIRQEQLKKLTHVIFLFVAIYEEDGSARFWDEHGKSRFLLLKEMAKDLNSGLKLMIGVGGYMVSPRFGPIVQDSEKRKKLINDTIALIEENELDGVEIFWIYPGQAHKFYFLKLIKELREKLSQLEQIKNRSESYILSMVAPKFSIQLKHGYDLEQLLEYVDFVDVLTYDYFQPVNSNSREESKYGPNSPIYEGNGKNIDNTMRYLACKTNQTNRFNMAISFYGNFWNNVAEPSKEDSGDIWIPSKSSKLSAVRWRELEENGWNKSSAIWHEKSKSSYIWIPETKTFLGFENEKSLEAKAKYVKGRDIGGFVIWAIDQDDDDNTLLNVVSSADLCSQEKKIEYKCGK